MTFHRKLVTAENALKVTIATITLIL